MILKQLARKDQIEHCLVVFSVFPTLRDVNEQQQQTKKLYFF